ncbi:type II toxin-antitoxin system RelE/ParE family toxin [Streptomyces violascens]|uniref:type II toxin-antitoxin system RelE/ParE family toxin n=1 Tax=Streptomyces violascens TaxID=67381 RepID=UPI0037876493
MTYEVQWRIQALQQAERLSKTEPEEIRQVFESVDLLADDPRPPGSVPYGVNIRRIYIGRYRVMYEISDGLVTVVVFHLGRTN